MDLSRAMIGLLSTYYPHLVLYRPYFRGQNNVEALNGAAAQKGRQNSPQQGVLNMASLQPGRAYGFTSRGNYTKLTIRSVQLPHWPDD